jgi:GxxExxY protein
VANPISFKRRVAEAQSGDQQDYGGRYWGSYGRPSGTGSRTARINLRSVHEPRAEATWAVNRKTSGGAIIYKGIQVKDFGFRIDMIVNKAVVVEFKSVEKLDPVHMAQVLTYLKLTKCTVGLIINFKVPLLKDGVKRVVMNFDES